jgi:hypothetical protein
MIQPKVSDELYASLIDAGHKKAVTGDIVVSRIGFSVALLEAYKQGFMDGQLASLATRCPHVQESTDGVHFCDKLNRRLDLAERLLSWAQNEEMIDTKFTAHGEDCIAVAALLGIQVPSSDGPPFDGREAAGGRAPPETH